MRWTGCTNQLGRRRPKSKAEIQSKKWCVCVGPRTRGIQTQDEGDPTVRVNGDAREMGKVRVSQKTDGVMRGKFSPSLRDFLLTGGVRRCKCSKDTTMNPGFLGWLGGT